MKYTIVGDSKKKNIMLPISLGMVQMHQPSKKKHI